MGKAGYITEGEGSLRLKSMRDILNLSKKETNSLKASSITLIERGTERDGRLVDSLNVDVCLHVQRLFRHK